MKNYPLAKPYVNQDDITAVTSVLTSDYLSRGPIVAKFEQDFCNITHSNKACAVSSGSAGLIIALQALGVKAGDEVITVSFTVSATVNCIIAIGAKPVMVDIETTNFGMCPDALLQAISVKTKAIIIVHAFGKSARTSEIIKLAKQYDIKVIEDACEAIGNSYDGKPLGSSADIGVFAFYPNKQVTTGEGGMLVTDDESLYEKFKLLRNHGRSMNGDLYDQVSFGWNFRMSDINAALGLSQIKRLKQIMYKRQEIANLYQNNLKSQEYISCPEFTQSESSSAWFVYVIRLLGQDRDKIMEKLHKEKIQCGRYFAPVHLQPFYREKFPHLTLENTENVANQSLALPFYLQLKAQDVKFICDRLVNSFL